MFKILSLILSIFLTIENSIVNSASNNITINTFKQLFNEDSALGFIQTISKQFNTLNFLHNSTIIPKSSPRIDVNLFSDTDDKSKSLGDGSCEVQQKIYKRNEEILEKALKEVDSLNVNKTDDDELNYTILHPIYHSNRFRLLNKDAILTNYGFFQVLKISKNGVRTWHTLCGKNWTTFSYMLACRALGFQKGKKVTTMMGFLGYDPNYVDYTGIRCQIFHDRFDNCFDEMKNSEQCNGDHFLPAYLHCLSWSHKNVAWLMGYFDGVHRIAYYFSFERKAYMISSKVGWNQHTTDLFCRQKKRTSGTYVHKKLEKMRLVSVVECSSSSKSSISLEKCIFSTMYANEVVAVNCYHNFVHDLMEEGKDVIIRQMAVGVMNVTMVTKNIIEYILVNEIKNIDFDCEELVLVNDNVSDVFMMNFLDLTIIKMNFSVGHKQSRSLRYTNSCMNNKSDSFSFVNFTFYQYRRQIYSSIFTNKFIMTIVIPAAGGGAILILIIAITVGVVVKRFKKKSKDHRSKHGGSKIIRDANESSFTKMSSGSNELLSYPDELHIPSITISPSEDD